jgi:hypothetical protein
VRIVPQGEEWIVQRLGKYRTTLLPGLRFIIPYIDIVSYKVTTKDIILDVQEQEVITRDNAVIVVNAIAFIKVTDPVKAVYGVQDYSEAIRNMIMTTLRSIVGDMELDQALSSRDTIKARLKAGVADEALDWGLTVKSVEIQDIKPSQSMQRAMEMQASAERERKAMVTRAEGEKQSMILTPKRAWNRPSATPWRRSPSPKPHRRPSARSTRFWRQRTADALPARREVHHQPRPARRVRQRQTRAPACRPAKHLARPLPARNEERAGATFCRSGRTMNAGWIILAICIVCQNLRPLTVLLVGQRRQRGPAGIQPLQPRKPTASRIAGNDVEMHVLVDHHQHQVVDRLAGKRRLERWLQFRQQSGEIGHFCRGHLGKPSGVTVQRQDPGAQGRLRGSDGPRPGGGVEHQ